MKWINIAFTIEDNTNSDLVEEWYNKPVVEATKTKKDFELGTPEKFTYSKWRKWDTLVEKYLPAKFNIRGVPLIYVTRKDKVPEIINIKYGIYNSNTEHFRMIAPPLTGMVYKKDKIEFHKFLKYPTQGTYACEWIEKCHGGSQAMQ